MRLKHARSRARRRVAQGRWTHDDLTRFAERRMFRSPSLRRSMRRIRGTDYRQRPFSVLQHKYPWPHPAGKNWSAHSAMLKRRMANLHKIHTAYRSR